MKYLYFLDLTLFIKFEIKTIRGLLNLKLNLNFLKDYMLAFKDSFFGFFSFGSDDDVMLYPSKFQMIVLKKVSVLLIKL